ncbi:MAG: hypothetical protein IPP73_10785 [Chitinophagaceae bacterium]|nr:hypothetical protein [Chitinophagaceae bacterium]
MGKSYDNRWMHRPVIDWNKNIKIEEAGTIEHRMFEGTKKLISIRRSLKMAGDYKNLTWLTPHNIHVAGFIRTMNTKKLYCLLISAIKKLLSPGFIFKEHGAAAAVLYDHWEGKEYQMGHDHQYLVMAPYTFLILEAR